MYLKAEHFGKVFINVVLRFLIFTFCQCFVSKYKSIFSEWIKVLYVNYLHGQQTKFIKKIWLELLNLKFLLSMKNIHSS